MPPALLGIARATNRTLNARLGLSVVRAGGQGVHPDAAWVSKFLYLRRVLRSLEAVEGTIVECGVADGSSLGMFASLCRDRRQERQIWGFDSWEGLPSPQREDLASPDSIAAQGMFASASPVRVAGVLRSHGFPEEPGRNIRLVAGRFEETLAGYQGGPIALLNVDADVYESYRVCLSQLWPLVTVGGVACLDEYHEPDLWPGARRAVDEFAATQPEGTLELVTDSATGRVHAFKRA